MRRMSSNPRVRQEVQYLRLSVHKFRNIEKIGTRARKDKGEKESEKKERCNGAERKESKRKKKTQLLRYV
jgi:hypothetical protein